MQTNKLLTHVLLFKKKKCILHLLIIYLLFINECPNNIHYQNLVFLKLMFALSYDHLLPQRKINVSFSGSCILTKSIGFTFK
jgi:hypothetical protein